MIDVVHQINEVTRRVGSRTLAAGEAKTVTLTQTYATDIDDLWSACTDPERIPRWFLPVSGELHVGGRYQLEGNAGGVVERCDPPHSFAATWEFGGGVTWIEVRLTAIDHDHTRFELEHIAHVDDHWDQFGPGAVGVGWDLGLIGLCLHLATRAQVDGAAVMAWTMSADGLDFARRSSAAWGEANAAAGTDRDVAMAAAERTTAAYTTIPEPGQEHGGA